MKTQNFYDLNAENYFQISMSEKMKHEMEKLVLKFLALTGKAENNLFILDAGSGSGRDAFFMAEKGCRVIGVDQSIELIKIAKHRSEQLRNGNQYNVPEFHQKRFDQINDIEKFDGVWCCASLLHVSPADFEVSLTHLVNSLKKGGVIYFSIKKLVDHYFNDGQREFFHPTHQKLNELFEKLGLEQIDFFENGKVDDPNQTFENYFLAKK